MMPAAVPLAVADAAVGPALNDSLTTSVDGFVNIYDPRTPHAAAAPPPAAPAAHNMDPVRMMKPPYSHPTSVIPNALFMFY